MDKADQEYYHFKSVCLSLVAELKQQKCKAVAEPVEDLIAPQKDLHLRQFDKVKGRLVKAKDGEKEQIVAVVDQRRPEPVACQRFNVPHRLVGP